MTTTSPGVDSPTRISASARLGSPGSRLITIRMRDGCSRAASVAARAASYWLPSSQTTTRVSTMLIAGAPIEWRSLVSVAEIFDAVVSVRLKLVILEPPPDAPVAGQHGVRRRRTPGAGRVAVRAAVRGPELLDRVEDLPGQLHLPLVREQRRVADQHVHQQPLVRLGRGFEEGLAVREV